MNIRDKDMWPKEEPPPQNSLAWAELLVRRQITAEGFTRIEEAKSGSLFIPTPLNTSKGQDMIRQLFWRCTEEMSESIDAVETDHVKEELIDAVNFLLIVPCLDEWTAISMEHLSEDLSTSIHFGNQDARFNQTTMQQAVISLARFGDNLRNRSWMHNVQDSYFEGSADLSNLIIRVINNLTVGFKWEDFWQYFVAKDNVLAFRLRSKY